MATLLQQVLLARTDNVRLWTVGQASELLKSLSAQRESSSWRQCVAACAVFSDADRATVLDAPERFVTRELLRNLWTSDELLCWLWQACADDMQDYVVEGVYEQTRANSASKTLQEWESALASFVPDD